jgi:protein-tyrosine phosphatase
VNRTPKPFRPKNQHDYNYILGDRLAQGCAPPTYDTSPGKAPFDVVVLCAREWQPHLPQYPRVMHAGFHDAKPTPSEIELAKATAREVVRQITTRGRRVLVTCHMGWNRSGLVTGLTLRHLGIPARETIHRIRKARGPYALSNRYFAKIVEEFEP